MQRQALDRLRVSRPGVLVERIEVAEGISGALGLEQRPDLQRLQVLAKARAFDELRVYALDRLTRAEDPRERFAVYGLVMDARAVIVETTGQVIDPCDDAGTSELQFGLQAWAAARERLRIIRRTMDGKARGAALGRASHGMTPFGLHFDKETGEWSIVEEKAAIVRRIFHAVADGAGLVTVARELQAAGVRTPRNKEKWSLFLLSSIVKNEGYRGLWRQTVREEVFACAVPAIIDRDLWQRANDGLAHRLNHRSGRPGSIEMLVRGRAFCGSCGRRLHCHVTRRDGRTFPYYACQSNFHRERNAPKCVDTWFAAREVEHCAWSLLRDAVSDRALLEEAAGLGATTDTASWDAQIRQCEARLGKIGKEVQFLAKFLADGDLTEAEVNDRRTELRRQRETVQRSLETARTAVAQAARQAELRASIEERVAAISADLQGELSFALRRQFVEAVVPDEEGFGITVHADGRLEVCGALPGAGLNTGAVLSEVTNRSRATGTRMDGSAARAALRVPSSG
jgi:site-specific DNA recombinase